MYTSIRQRAHGKENAVDEIKKLSSACASARLTIVGQIRFPTELFGGHPDGYRADLNFFPIVHFTPLLRTLIIFLKPNEFKNGIAALIIVENGE